jgi:predicted TIM-barrel fold metal-dependent hydrolase
MVRAIDVHIHPPGPAGESLTSSRVTQEYFRAAAPPSSVEEMADHYARLDIFGVLFTVDNETVSGRAPSPSNDYVADIVRRYPKQFAAFASIDPWKGKAALNEIERCAKDLGVRGLKFMPNTQQFYPNDERFYPLWELAQKLRLVVLIHSGTTGVGAGHPGGAGVKLKYSRPIPYIDDVAADFPELKVIMAHPAWPWQEEQLAVLVHKPNVYVDLSGWSPKYFQPSLVQYANTLIQDKVLFGSDYPVMTPERWLADFEQAAFRDEVRPKILLENARKLLGIDF